MPKKDSDAIGIEAVAHLVGPESIVMRQHMGSGEMLVDGESVAFDVSTHLRDGHPVFSFEDSKYLIEMGWEQLIPIAVHLYLDVRDGKEA